MSNAKISDVEIRLACIQAAAKHAPFRYENVVSIANDYYRFVIGETDANAKKQADHMLAKIALNQ
jgi:hypothetical protein